MILSGLATVENAVVIIDELGRGTSPEEGKLMHVHHDNELTQAARCGLSSCFG